MAKQLKLRLSRGEKRGISNIEGRAKPRKALKRPLTAYVNYESQGGDLVCFAVPNIGSARYESLVASCYYGIPNVVRFHVSAHPDGRLIELPSAAPTVLLNGAPVPID